MCILILIYIRKMALKWQLESNTKHMFEKTVLSKQHTPIDGIYIIAAHAGLPHRVPHSLHGHMDDVAAGVLWLKLLGFETSYGI